MYVCPQLLNMLINLNMLCVNLQSRAEVNGANVSRKIIGELSKDLIMSTMVQTILRLTLVARKLWYVNSLSI